MGGLDIPMDVQRRYRCGPLGIELVRELLCTDPDIII